jgi:gluconolactonase
MRLSRIILAGAIGLAGACGALQRETANAEPGVIQAFYPEGPIWQGDKLYYAEMGADRISVYENGARRTFYHERGCGPTALAPYGGGFLVLCHLGAHLTAVDGHGRKLRAWTSDDAGNPLRDPNDGYEDGRGGVYFSDPDAFSRLAPPNGYVMHLTASGALTRVLGPLWYPNGVYTDIAHRKVYVDEHMAGRVLRYDLNADGSLTNREVFVDLANVEREKHFPYYREAGCDGLEMGPDGDLWVSIYGEGHILRFSPQGRLVGTLETPTQYLTNIAFNAHGDAATTGSFDNINPPYLGEVRLHPASSLTRRAN